METIVYVAMGLNAIFVAAFIGNIVSFFVKVVSSMINERRDIRRYSNTGRRSMANPFFQQNKKAKVIEHQKVEQSVTV